MCINQSLLHGALVKDSKNKVKFAKSIFIRKFNLNLIILIGEKNYVGR